MYVIYNLYVYLFFIHICLSRWAAYYNGGNIPLASVLPLLHRLPWVFTYNRWVWCVWVRVGK